MTCCAFCGISGHNIRGCNSHGVAFALMKLRGKHWKSIRKLDLNITFAWLRNQPVPVLRVICIHKYKTFPKTNCKIKLVAILMHLEFYHVVDEADIFWRYHLPPGYENSTFDCDNVHEKALLIVNINTYQPSNDDLRFKSNEDLGDILMNLITEYRQTTVFNRRTRYRTRIDYLELSNDVEEQEEEEKECSICYDKIINIAKLGCNHEFCCACIEMHIRGTRIAIVNCPLCRGEIGSVSAVRNGNSSLISIL